MKSAESFHRCDIVTDQYFNRSLKEGVRDSRGSEGIVILFNDQTPLPSKFESNFLTNGTNKTNLNEYLAQKFIAFHHNNSQILCATYKQQTILSNQLHVITEESIANCSCEEADARIIRHAINLGRNGYKNVQIQTVDNNVLVLSLGYAKQLKDAGLEQLFVNYGPIRVYYNVFKNLSYLGNDICKALPFLLALTGCDTTSSFYKIGKTTHWTTWMKMHDAYPALTNAFLRLSNQPTGDIDAETLHVIIQFVYQCYGLIYTERSSAKTLRVQHITNTPNLTLRELVPSIHGVLQHIRRCCIQVGYLWKLADFEIDIPDPTLMGLEIRGNKRTELLYPALARPRDI